MKVALIPCYLACLHACLRACFSCQSLAPQIAKVDWHKSLILWLLLTTLVSVLLMDLNIELILASCWT